MGSLSPIIRNHNVRRLSLELVQKFTSPFLSPQPQPTQSKRRASDAFLKGTGSGGSGGFSAALFPNAARGLSNLSPALCDSVFGPEVAVKCNVIPATPRRSSFSAFFGEGCSPPRKQKRRKSSLTHYELGNDFTKLAFNKSGLEVNYEEVLGRGSFGTVLEASYKGKKVAVKVLRSLKDERHLEGELHALSLPPHPSIVSVLDVLRIPNRALIIMEKMEKGNLLTVLNDLRVVLELRDVVRISSQISDALSFCHNHGILHLDVKPQNILIHSSGCVKLSDFGNSKLLHSLIESERFTKLDGTVGYKAPELFKGDRPTEKSDVYSMGITMWHLHSREPPYLGENEHSVIYKVVAQNLRPRSYCSFMSNHHPLVQEYIQIYKQSWSGDPSLRQDMPQLQAQLGQLAFNLTQTKV